MTGNMRDLIEEKVRILNEARRAYEQEEIELMSNAEYDALYDELEALEKETGIVLADSPTVNVGYEVLSDLPKEVHPSRMLSLDKTKDVEVLKSFIKDKEGLLSWKLDGLTIVLTYEDGVLLKAVTRGNGEIGEVITQNAKTFKNIPLKIPYKGRLVLRGEAYITYSQFHRINSEMESVEAKYKNPRNLCAGTVRQLDPAVTAARGVSFNAFTLVEAENVDFKNSREEQLKFLSDQGFVTVENQRVTADTMEEAVRWFAGEILTYDIPSDGLVLCFDDIQYGKSLGATAKFPRDAIAFKWKDETAKTRLLEVEWSPSRTGLINPVAIFEPVELEGTTVSRASLHNVSILKQLRLGIGDEIEVYKANMIIPQVLENHTKSGNLDIPEFCPVCGQNLAIRDENGVQTLVCNNPDCQIKHIKSFEHFASREALNIEGMSEATIEKFVDQGIIRTYADFFRLDRWKDTICSMEGFGIKSFENMTQSAKKASETECYRLLYAIGIPNIGVANAKVIAKECRADWEKIVSLSFEELIAINGIGEIMAKEYVRFFENEKNLEKLEELLPYLHLKAAEEEGEQDLSGKTFVITGSLNTFENRDEMKLVIERRGGKVAGSVSSKTDYLVNNDITSSSSKNKKAKELGIPIITEEEFLEM